VEVANETGRPSRGVGNWYLDEGRARSRRTWCRPTQTGVVLHKSKWATEKEPGKAKYKSWLGFFMPTFKSKPQL